MTYPSPHDQPTYPASYPQPPAYPSLPIAKPPKRVWGMPVWVFVILSFVVVVCGGCGAMALFGGLLNGVEEATTADPTFACTVLSVDDNEVLPSVEVEWQITNPDDREVNELVDVTVLDSQGRQIGDTFAGAFDVASGATVVDTETVFLDAAPTGGETCSVAVSE